LACLLVSTGAPGLAAQNSRYPTREERERERQERRAERARTDAPQDPPPGEKPQENEPEPPRGNERTRPERRNLRPAETQPATPEEARQRAGTKIAASIKAGVSPDALVRLMDEASTGALPPPAQARQQLAVALRRALSGRPVTPDNAGKIAAALAAAANADDLATEKVAEARSGLESAMSAPDTKEEFRAAVLTRFDAAIGAQQKQNVLALKRDLVALQEESDVTPEQVTALKASLAAAAEGATKPGDAAVQALAEDLGAALDNGQLSAKEQALLAQDLGAVLSSANVPRDEAEASIQDARGNLAASHVSSTDLQKIGKDLRVIYAELNPPVTRPRSGATSRPATRPGG
jgi:hypothetical protein